MKTKLIVALSLLLGAVCAPTARAQEVLPKPEPPFKGTIGQTVKESKADYPKPLEAPAGAPNVLIIILDDVGFGHAATFGGAVATPTLDRLAARAACATISFTPPRCVRPRAARCSPAATTTASARA